MNEIGVKELELLLNNFWITKEQNPDLYYQIKNKIDSFKDFIQDQLGSKIIVNSKFIKLEKIPVYPLEYMKINKFENRLEYIFMILTLLFLEDKIDKETFTLSDLIDFIKNNAIILNLEVLPNWNLYSHRKWLENVLIYLTDLNVIRVKDKTKVTFIDSQESDWLCEATGLANYLIREFNHEILDYTQVSDFIEDEWLNQIQEKGDIRRYKVYRNLLFTPVAYTSRLHESETDYIRKFRGSIKNELEKYTNGQLEVDKSMSLLFYDYDNKQKQFFPNTKAISDIVLIINKEIVQRIDIGELLLDEQEMIKVSESYFARLVKDVKENYAMYLSKQYKDMTFNSFYKEILSYMESYDFISKDENDYNIYPMTFKIYGTILDIKEESTEQLNMFGGSNE
ncbi:MAG: TIGR02678 family protein [Clostridia bacterium]